MDNSLNPCPYLRVKNDPDTWCAYPSRSNHCHHAKPNQAVSPLYQENVCLRDVHINCPVYKHDGLWPGKLPEALRTDEGYKAAMSKMAQAQSESQPIAAPIEVHQAEAEATPEPVALETEAVEVEAATFQTSEPAAEVVTEFAAEPVEVEESLPAEIEPAAEVFEEIAPEPIEVEETPAVDEEIAPEEVDVEASQPELIALEEEAVELEAASQPAIQAVSPAVIAAEVFAGTRTNPPPVGSGGTGAEIAAEKAAQKGQQRRTMLWAGIVGGIVLCLLIGVGAASMMRGALASRSDATPTIAATATDDPSAALTADASRATQTPSITPSAAATTAVPNTPIAADPQPATMRFETNMRAGPGTEYGVIGTIGAGAPILVIGRDQLGVWLAVRLPSGQEGWVPASQVNTENVSVLSAPLLEVTYAAQDTVTPQP